MVGDRRDSGVIPAAAILLVLFAASTTSAGRPAGPFSRIPMLLAPQLSPQRYVLVEAFISGVTERLTIAHFRNSFGTTATEELRLQGTAEVRLEPRCPAGLVRCDEIMIEEMGVATAKPVYYLGIMPNSDSPSGSHGRFPPRGWKCPDELRNIDECRNKAVHKFVRLLVSHHELHLRSFP